MIAVFEGANVRQIVEQVRRELIEDASGLLEEIAEKVVFPSIQRNFDEEGRPEWAELRPRTQREREAQGYAPEHPILVRSGELKHSVTNKDDPLLDYQVGKKELRMSPMLRKAYDLHVGDELKGLVARPFFWLHEEDGKNAERAGIKYLQAKVMGIVSRSRLTGIEEMLK